MNERKWHEWNSTFPQWKEKIVEIELVCSHFPSHILKVTVLLLLPPLFLPSSAPSCFRFTSWKRRRRRRRKSDLVHRLSIRVIWWRAPQNQWVASADRKVAHAPEAVFSWSLVAVWGGPDPLWLHGSRATRAAVLCCSISRDCTIFYPLSCIISVCSPSVSSTLCSWRGL